MFSKITVSSLKVWVASSFTMPITLLPQLLFICILSTIISITNFTHAYSHCLEDQKTLLLELKNDLIFNSSVSRKLVQWNHHTDDCCRWEGVECDGAGHVISLQLDDEAISGGLENSSSLFSLMYLEKLNLANNDFNKTQIPRGIHNLAYLTHLNLSHAGFGGQVPVELSLLRRLVSLDISSNWGIHLNLAMLLQNLTGLRELYLDSADISAQASKWCQVISSSLPDIRNLSLRYCNLLGPLDPSLSQLHSLSILRLDGNNLLTAVPDFFANFSSLTTLSLSQCSLIGSFPELIFQVPTLQNLDLSDNELLSGTIPQFPQDGALRSIELGFTNFSGSIPNSFSNLSMLSNIYLTYCSFTGPIHPMLANLTELIYVDLSDNFFTGLVPSFYTSKKLTHINLSHNSLTGSLSSKHFEGLSNLVYLQLSYNLLKGSIPQSLFGLPSLQILSLSNNQFSGQVDEFPTLNFSYMTDLDLRSNRLEGPIPKSFFKLESLQVLRLSNNFFNGTFQLEKIQRLCNLTDLNLSYNNLSVNASNINSSSYGFSQLQWLSLASCNLHNLPDFVFQLEKIQWLRNLRALDLSYNRLSVDASNINSSSYGFPQLSVLVLASCNLHNFPGFIKQYKLYALDLSNNRIAGEIPSWIWEIGNGTLEHLNLSSNLLVDLQKPYHMPTSLYILDLNSNQLRGELPLPSQDAIYIDYSNNNFDKPIPPNIGNTSSVLSFLSLANNSLSGAIPTSLCNSSNLEILDLSFNNLSGIIPPCLFDNIEWLAVFNLKGNNISGDIPDKFTVDCRLKDLYLSNNNLGGNIPKSLANCKSLEVFNVGNNNINDSFPCMLPSSLRVLVLRSNRFHGEVICHRSWPNLQIIDIASNNFSGYLYPISFSSWRGMMAHSDVQLRRTNLGYGSIPYPRFYHFTEVTLTIKGVELKLVKIWTDYTSIDFSCNNFQGEIPDSIGDLRSLYLLNLSNNALTGTIPKSFGNLRHLGSLDLSANQLTGMIPMELAGLTFLSHMNLSYNKLVGMIPNGPQFQTFSAGFFEGNAGLCGFPLNISCSSTNENDLPPKPETAQPHRKMEIEWGYVCAAFGYVVGLGSIVWILLCCQSFREKYFEKVDEVLEKIFNHHDRKRRHGRRVLRNRVRRQ